MTMKRLAFQSTRPMRGATWGLYTPWLRNLISIHAPHAGRDMDGGRGIRTVYGFQSTRPMRGATVVLILVRMV